MLQITVPHMYSVDPKLQLNCCCHWPRRGGSMRRLKSTEGGQAPSPIWIPPQGHGHRPSGRGFSLSPALLHVVLQWKAAAWWPKQRVQSCSPRARILKPCSPLLWKPLDQTVFQVAVFQQLLNTSYNLKNSYKKESKSLILCFSGKFT